MQEIDRRLAAVWFADIVGFTPLANRDEDAALETVAEFQAAAREAVAELDALARGLLACRGGRERLIRHLERRGEFAAALEVAGFSSSVLLITSCASLPRSCASPDSAAVCPLLSPPT